MSILDIIAPTVAEAERIEAGGEVRPYEVAALLRHNADMVADYANALNDEREASAKLSKTLESREKYVIRKDYSGENLGVIYTHPDMIGTVVAICDTGERVPL